MDMEMEIDIVTAAFRFLLAPIAENFDSYLTDIARS